MVMSSSDAGPTPAPPRVTGAKGSKLKTYKVEGTDRAMEGWKHEKDWHSRVRHLRAVLWLSSVLSGQPCSSADLGEVEWTFQPALAGPIAEEVAPGLLQGRQLCATWAARRQGQGPEVSGQ